MCDAALVQRAEPRLVVTLHLSEYIYIVLKLEAIHAIMAGRAKKNQVFMSIELRCWVGRISARSALAVCDNVSDLCQNCGRICW